MGRDAGEFVQAGQLGVDIEPLPETLEKRGLYGLDEVRH